jgi:hypothetical protein
LVAAEDFKSNFQQQWDMPSYSTMMRPSGGEHMYLIAVTNWKHKIGVAIRLLLFLLLIWMITPQFLNFISGHIASFKSHLPQSQPSGIRVEQPIESSPVHGRGDRFLQWLQGYYSGDAR